MRFRNYNIQVKENPAAKKACGVFFLVVPAERLELPTFELQIRCSTN